MEAGDVGRLIERSTQRVRDLVKERRLEPFAMTPRGLKLFRAEDVSIFLARRRQRSAGAE